MSSRFRIAPPAGYVRCGATATRTGKQCRRGAAKGSTVCEQHAPALIIARLVYAICRAVENVDDHSHFNDHFLDPRVGMGHEPCAQRGVPAIRTSLVWAAVGGALREVGLDLPAEYAERIDCDRAR